MHSPLAANDESARATSRLRGYRPDIDGLRAVAVLSVVGYHAFPAAFPSGFVGVDVFFVISGFLITSIILDEVARDRFSFVTFYARRVRRLFPALLLVTAVCLVAGWLVLWPEDFRRLGKHALAGAAFLTNFALWREANYFDVASDTKVLLHLWSLAIEEQFYLIWPALIAIAWRMRLNLFMVFAAIFAASLAYGIKITATNQVAAFFSPASRFWELAAGALLAQASFAWPSRFARPENPSVGRPRTGPFSADAFARQAAGALGLVLVLAAVFLISVRDAFPGWWALMPVAGAGLIIFGGPEGWVNRRLLSTRLMVFIGTISYPLYLWHWPLLAFAKDILHHETSAAVRGALVAGAVGLAWLTYQFVERPIRMERRERRVAPPLCAAMLAIAACGAIILVRDGFPQRFPDEKSVYAQFFDRGSQRTIDEARLINQLPCNFYSFDSPTPTRAPRPVDPVCYTRHTPRSVLILGDSNGADLYHGLKQVLPESVSLLLLYSSGCRVQPFSEELIESDHCHKANHFALERIKADPPDIVLMASYNSYDIGYVRAYATLIRQHGVKHVLVLGQRPHWRYDLHRIILDEFWSYTPRRIPGRLDESLHALGRQFEAQLRAEEPFEYVDQMQPFCNSDGCLTYLGDDRRDGLITNDTAHLRPHASVWLAREHLAPLILSRLER
ncbi:MULTISPECIES: acyltransferase family protein [unclassified Bradyrhizobium]|uniref:acyltransferase family protein n=1 Tax=unclassified Bradyrhizobium TaxID=2631580 RepID=UPI0028E985CE|nr:MULTISPECIES: acyltransferase family protein [unclassified Bradyrhizobium]